MEKDASRQQAQIHQMVSFVIDREEYGVDIMVIREIIRPTTISRVPNSPDYVEGVINLRGKIIPVVDLRKRLGFPPVEADKYNRIIIMKVNERTVGFVVDRVKEVLRVDEALIEPAPELTLNVDSRYITGVAKLPDRLLILLDLERVLSEDTHTHIPQPEKG